MDILIEEFQENIWAVALDKGRIDGLEIDPHNEEVRYGSIYWAKVERIDRSLDAAFLDLDGQNQGILYNRDTRIQDESGKWIKGGEKPIGKILQPGTFVAVQAKTAYLSQFEGEQAYSEDKIPQMSMDISIAGRYLIYCPLMQKNQLSQRIRGKKLRAQMEEMMEALHDMRGFILRSAAADMQTDILQREGKIISAIWGEISAFFNGDSPNLIALGPDSIQRILSDHAMNPIDRIEIVTMDHFTQIEDWCSIFAPDLVTKISPVELNDATQDLALFEYRDILGQIESLCHEYAILPSGGNIIIQPTAALTAIDINKGGDSRSHLSVNLEAAQQIVRQIRLRNIGGIITVDFLNMKADDQKTLLKALDDLTYKDPCTVQIHGFTKLGLLEMTRKRRTPPLHDRFVGLEL